MSSRKTQFLFSDWENETLVGFNSLIPVLCPLLSSLVLVHVSAHGSGFLLSRWKSRNKEATSAISFDWLVMGFYLLVNLLIH